MVTPTPAVPAISVRAMLAGMRAIGLDIASIARRSGLPDLDSIERSGPIPDCAYEAMWREARREARDDAIGAAIGAAVPMGMFGVVDYLAASASNLGESVASTRDFTHLTSDSSFWEIEHGAQGELTARFVNAVVCQEDDVGDEFALSLILHRMYAWVQRPLQLREVQLTRRRPLALLDRLFSSRVSYGHGSSQFVLGPGAADLALEPADPRLHAALLALLRESGKDLGSRTRATASVRRCAQQLLAQANTLTLRTVSRRLGLSQRTLQRQLMDEGTCFERTLDELRRDMAQRRLRAEDRPSVLQVAIEVGFADERSLARAFHRWTGMSPRQWRNTTVHSLGASQASG